MLGKQAADLCTSTLTQYFVREYFAEGRWREYVDDLVEIYREPPRRDAGGAGRALPGRGDLDEPEGGLFIWATLPAYIDTSDLLAKALRENVAFVPGQAAYVDGRGGSSMRLNFSGVDEDEIREGIRRIGKTIAEQVELYDTLTGEATQRLPVPRTRPSPDAADEVDVCRSARRRGIGMRVAVLKGGRSLERGVSLRSGARVEDALRRLGHEVVPIDVGADLVKRLGRARPTSPSSRCTASAARTAPSRSCWRSSGSPTPGPGCAACARCMDKVPGQARDARGRRPHPRLVRLQPGRLPRARRRRRPGRSSIASASRWW